MPPVSNDDIHFQGSNRTTNTNDLGNLPVASLSFDSNAASFDLQGMVIQFTMSGSANTITNNSTNTQTIDFVDNGPYTGLWWR